MSKFIDYSQIFYELFDILGKEEIGKGLEFKCRLNDGHTFVGIIRKSDESSQIYARMDSDKNELLQDPDLNSDMRGYTFDIPIEFLFNNLDYYVKSKSEFKVLIKGEWVSLSNILGENENNNSEESSKGILLLI